ncbi:hypothetical protein LQ757_02295 [Agromyces sp. SYSU K20354]|uniref:hypothetical protein n=1 Tax=Agromyces cavernae TaxID=2898659 RepID=UPI001E5B392D|nr:hypothetical protein [Agromyces cavernae]MCD2441097.1 hypothetical protein [Agromyces cavernae]
MNSELIGQAVVLPTAADRIDAAVLGWCRWYTRDLPEQVATGRIAELASDLHEQRAFAAETGGPGASRAIVGRMLRGIPADLAWRHARLRRAALTAPRGTFPLALPALAHLATALLIAWGVLVVVRTSASMGSGDWAGAWDLVAAGIVGLAMALLGAVLTAIPRLRWFGALWLAGASYVLIRFGMYTLIASSVTLGEFYTSALAQAILVNRSLAAAGVTFFVAMAAWWLPAARSLWGSKPRRTDVATEPFTEGVGA